METILNQLLVIKKSIICRFLEKEWLRHKAKKGEMMEEEVNRQKKTLKRKVTICFNSDSRGSTIYRKQRIVVC